MVSVRAATVLCMLIMLAAGLAWVAGAAARDPDESPGNHTFALPADPELLDTFRETPAEGVYNGTVRRSDGGDVAALKDPQLASQLVLLADASTRARSYFSIEPRKPYRIRRL